MTNKPFSEPIHVVVFNTLRDRILRGEFLPGSLLPTEKELCLEFGATRATVRKGLNRLEHLGFIRSDPGKGSFVIQPQLNRFLFTISDDYPDCDIEVLEPRVVPPDENVRRALRLPPDGQALECRRVMRQNGIPVALDDNFAPYTPTRAAVQQAAEFALFSRINEASDQPFSFSNHMIIQAAAATGEIAALLGQPAGTPLLVVVRFLFGKEDSRRGFGKKYLVSPYGMIRSTCSYLPSPSNVFEDMQPFD